MEEDSKELTLKILGILFILFSSWSFVNQIFSNEPFGVLWLCYIGLLLMGIGCLINSRELIISQILIISLPAIIWNVDFLYLLFSGNSLFGITNYFFSSEHGLVDKIISLQHIISIPLGIFAAVIAKSKHKFALIISFIEVIIIFSLSAVLSSRQSNINCIFEPCFNIYLPGPYIVYWFGGMIINILIVYFIYGIYSKPKSNI